MVGEGPGVVNQGSKTLLVEFYQALSYTIRCRDGLPAGLKQDCQTNFTPSEAIVFDEFYGSHREKEAEQQGQSLF
jgi:hypothetical protein